MYQPTLKEDCQAFHKALKKMHWDRGGNFNMGPEIDLFVAELGIPRETYNTWVYNKGKKKS